MTEDEIQDHVDAYLGDRKTTARYSSFDYCFNWFQAHREADRVAQLVEPTTLQSSCLQLGFYLASWGMYRGGAELLKHSATCLGPVIHAVVDAPAEIWDVDVGGYDTDGIDLVLEVGRSLRRAFPGRASDTLVTKAMLGVFGCVPAFDRFFRSGFRASTFHKKALRRIGEFHRDHADVIERNCVPTLDFASGELTERPYSRAKVVDMIFFMKGGGGPAVVTAT